MSELRISIFDNVWKFASFRCFYLQDFQLYLRFNFCSKAYQSTNQKRCQVKKINLAGE